MRVAGASYPIRINANNYKLEIILENNELVNDRYYSVALICWSNANYNSISRLASHVRVGHVSL